jgi:hypothetical protein
MYRPRLQVQIGRVLEDLPPGSIKALFLDLVGRMPPQGVKVFVGALCDSVPAVKGPCVLLSERRKA